MFIVVGVALNCGYNLELLGGRLHNDVTFAAAWGSFPVLTAYYAQAETLRLPALAAAAAAYWLSSAQRSLSTPARTLRRRVASVDGTVTYSDGHTASLSTARLLAPLEAALKATAWGLVALAVALRPSSSGSRLLAVERAALSQHPGSHIAPPSGIGQRHHHLQRRPHRIAVHRTAPGTARGRPQGDRVGSGGARSGPRHLPDQRLLTLRLHAT